MATKRNLEEVEVIDFEDVPPKKKIDNKIKSKNKINTSKNKNNNKINILPIVFIIIGLLIIAGGIYITKVMVEDSNRKKQEELEKEVQQIVSSINVNNELNKIIDINNFKFINNINVYTKGEKNSIYKINNIFTYNENIYKVDKIQTIQSIEYKSTNYYTKGENEYLEYINDLTSDTYTRNSIDENNYNSKLIFNNFVKYLIDNNEIKDEEMLKIGDEEIINIILSTNKEILNTLTNCDNSLNIDVSKLSGDKFNIELYFTKNDKKLYEINFKIEDKYAYQQDISSEIEYSTNTYRFSEFNNTDILTLPY